MAISYVASEAKYYANSTDDKTSISNQEGAKIYYVDIQNTQVCHGGLWYDYNDPVSLVSRLVKQVTLQTNATVIGNGTSYTPATPQTLNFEISGTSTSRTINFEIAGPKGVYQAISALKLGDTTYTPTTSTTGGSDTTPETWEVDIPSKYSFRARISAIAGGDVDISGWEVSQ